MPAIKPVLALIFWLFAGLPAFAQLEQTARAELPLQSDLSDYEVWPRPDSSVLVLGYEPPMRRKADPFTFYRFNATLSQEWNTPVKVPAGCKFVEAAFERNLALLLFQSNRPYEFYLVVLNSRTGNQAMSMHKLPERASFTPADLELLNGYLFLTGTQNERLLLLHLHPEETEFRMLPALYDQSTNLTEFYADTVAQRMEFVLAESNGQRGRLQIKRLAPDGRLLSLNFIQAPDRNFLAARLAPGDSSRKLVAGSYSLRDLRYAQGFFVSPLAPQNGEKPRYHEFTGFSHYFDYMRPGRQQRVKQRIERYKLSRKVFQLRQRILLHSLQPYQDGFLMTGELYYPHYTGDVGNRVFDGYQHTTAIVAAFDKAGNLRWDNSFPLQNQLFFRMKEVVSVAVAGDQVVMAYTDHEKVKYKFLNGGQSTPNDRFLEISSGAERALFTSPDGIKPWYGKHLLTFGTQQVRGIGGSREVLYLCRLSAANGS